MIGWSALNEYDATPARATYLEDLRFRHASYNEFCKVVSSVTLIFLSPSGVDDVVVVCDSDAQKLCDGEGWHACGANLKGTNICLTRSSQPRKCDL
jgi:hypothetical protein